jgi:hypothetical protein
VSWEAVELWTASNGVAGAGAVVGSVVGAVDGETS